jgi:glycogen(starch) synthase
VLASTSVETFSMAMLESMAAAVPVIVPQIGGLPEAIIEGESGRLFPVGDVHALATCMQSLVDDPVSAARMGERAAHRLAREFTFDKMIDESEKALSEAARVFSVSTGTPRRSRA